MTAAQPVDELVQCVSDLTGSVVAQLSKGDSELVVKQMRGEYRVKNEALRALWEQANDLEGRFAKVRYTAVKRAHNELADSLVNEALDAQI